MGISKIDQYIIDRVKERREKIKWSQEDLAFELGVSKGFIGNVESTRYPHKYSMEQINHLAKIFKCTIWDLVPQKPL
ncbi:helix-turn-helix domain-containing protein [Chitinophaga varians]|uniref:helix-turn-helix domain-containing protein n=1 Tax=Chitinophaga varians TaxID=2202339 RepID=UPI00165F29F6|nr:helix-turn-helix transcriptional regulator [Chitinophaga varians]